MRQLFNGKVQKQYNPGITCQYIMRFFIQKKHCILSHINTRTNLLTEKILSGRSIFRFLQIFALLFYLPSAPGAESIAEIKNYDTELINQSGTYKVGILSIATLSNVTIDGFKVSELSGLAWDEDENILYALSDNGYLLHLKPVFRNGHLFDVEFLAGYHLLDNKNHPLKYKDADSEGLAIINGNNGRKSDTELLVCFERKPRLIKFKPDGVPLSNITLPDALSDIKNYRSENRSLEAVTIHKKFGIMLGPENPLSGQDDALMYIYSVNGKIWNVPLKNTNYGALVDMTTMPDDSLLLLERAYGGLFPTMEISLHKLIPDEGEGKNELIYSFPDNDGMFDENFEGITHFKNNEYFMISDDNNHPLSRILLVHFSITKIQ